jgi:hypothetical protein
MSKRPTKIIIRTPSDSATAVNVTTKLAGTIRKLFLSPLPSYQALTQCLNRLTRSVSNTSDALSHTTTTTNKTTAEYNQTMKPLFTAHDGQTLYTATHSNGQRLYIVQEAASAGTQVGYHVIWNPAQTPRELLQAAIQHDRRQDIRLTATDVPNQDIKTTAESDVHLNHNSMSSDVRLDLGHPI